MASHGSSMDRREFFRRTGQTAALAAGLALAAAATAAKTPVVKADPHHPKTGRLVKKNKRIGIGIIGVGSMGGSHLRDLIDRQVKGKDVVVQAVSDVYERRKRWCQNYAKEKTKKKLEAYTDYKKLIERNDINAVVIASPDHWHAQMSIDAMKAGKDVYCQKPVTLTTEESLLVRDTAYETGRIFQCGAQYTSEDFYWQARKFIAKGGIGPVVYAQGDYSRNSAGGPNERGGEWNYAIHPEASDDPKAGEFYIDWARWLGPAPKRPFSKPRFFQFRKYWDYSGGIATDLLYHFIAPLTIALDAQAPERACASGGIFVQQDDREVPDTFLVTLDYPNDFSVLLTSSMANRQGNQTMIRGHRATIRPHADGAMRVTAEDEFKEWFKKEFGAEEIIVPAEKHTDHMTNWLEAIRTRGEVNCPPEIAYRAMAATRMACDAYRQEKVIFWDSVNERYVDSHPRPNRVSKVPAIPS